MQISSRQLQRSVSDMSLASGRSYVSAINISPFDIISWKINRGRAQAAHVEYNLEKMPETPPPIPPPKRPSDTSHYSYVDEIYERTRPPNDDMSYERNHYINYNI